MGRRPFNPSAFQFLPALRSLPSDSTGPATVNPTKTITTTILGARTPDTSTPDTANATSVVTRIARSPQRKSKIDLTTFVTSFTAEFIRRRLGDFPAVAGHFATRPRACRITPGKSQEWETRRGRRPTTVCPALRRPRTFQRKPA